MPHLWGWTFPSLLKVGFPSWLCSFVGVSGRRLCSDSRVLKEAYDITCWRRLWGTRGLCSQLGMDLWTARRSCPEIWCRSGWQGEVAEVTTAESVYSWTRLLSFKGKLEIAVAFAAY